MSQNVSQKIKNIMRKKIKIQKIKNEQIKNQQITPKDSESYSFYAHINNYELYRIGVSLTLDHAFFKMSKYDIKTHFDNFWLNDRPDKSDIESLKNKFYSYDMNYGRYEPSNGPYEHDNEKRNRAVKCHDGKLYLRINLYFNHPFTECGLREFCTKIFINTLKEINGDEITTQKMSEKEELKQKRCLVYMREYSKIIKEMKKNEDEIKYKEMCDKFLQEKLHKNEEYLKNLVYDEKTIHKEKLEFICW